MNLYDALTTEDIDLIRAYIEAYGGKNDEYDATGCYVQSMPNTMAPWAEAKERLYTMFGEQLVLRKSFNFSKGVEELADEINDARYRRDGNGIAEMDDLIRQNFWPRNIYSTLGLDDDQADNICRLIDSYMLANNSWSRTEFTVNGVRVNTGAKAVKILGKILATFENPEWNEIFEQFRLEHSRILNQKKLTGELCLSIHPLDFMTMSDNNEGWDSCMSWQACGDYRQGTVEMMNSPCVVVAYLRNPDYEMDIPDGHWNSKKWRCLFVVDRDVIVNIREYPYCNDELVGECLNWLKSLAEKNLHYQYRDTTCRYRADCENTVQVGEKRIPVNFSTGHMYSDFRFEHLMYLNAALPEKIDIYYSGVSECLGCGKTSSGYDESLLSSNDLICHSCNGDGECEECGRYCDAEELYEVEGRLICQDCYDNETAECPACQREVDRHNEKCEDWRDQLPDPERHFIHSDNTFEIAFNGYITHLNLDTLCKCCADKIRSGEIKDYGPVEQFVDKWNISHTYLDLEKMTEEAQKDVIAWNAKGWMENRRDSHNHSWVSLKTGYCDFDKHYFVDEDEYEIKNPHPFSFPN